MGAARQSLSRRSFAKVAGAAVALGALSALPPRWLLAGDGAKPKGEGLQSESAGVQSESAGAASFPIVEFGTYPQGAAGGVEPIEWYVLDERYDYRLLLSKYVLDAQPYNEDDTDVTWETCTLRAWLNSDFLKTAFSADEQARIVEEVLENHDNPDFGTLGGKRTRDRVFCLSIWEAMLGFRVRRTWKQLGDDLGDDWYLDNDGRVDYGRIYAEVPGYKALVAHATDYALARDVWTWVEPDNPYAGGSRWWLRSPGEYADAAADVGNVGFFCTPMASSWTTRLLVCAPHSC